MTTEGEEYNGTDDDNIAHSDVDHASCRNYSHESGYMLDDLKPTPKHKRSVMLGNRINRCLAEKLKQVHARYSERNGVSMTFTKFMTCLLLAPMYQKTGKMDELIDTMVLRADRLLDDDVIKFDELSEGVWFDLRTMSWAVCIKKDILIDGVLIDSVEHRIKMRDKKYKKEFLRASKNDRQFYIKPQRYMTFKEATEAFENRKNRNKLIQEQEEAEMARRISDKIRTGDKIGDSDNKKYIKINNKEIRNEIIEEVKNNIGEIEQVIDIGEIEEEDIKYEKRITQKVLKNIRENNKDIRKEKRFDEYRFHEKDSTLDELEEYQKMMKEVSCDCNIGKKTEYSDPGEKKFIERYCEVNNVKYSPKMISALNKSKNNNSNSNNIGEIGIIKNGVNSIGVKLTPEELALCGHTDDTTERGGCDGWSGTDNSLNENKDQRAEHNGNKSIIRQNIRHKEYINSNNDKNWEGMDKYSGNDITRMEKNIKSYDPVKTKGSMVAKDPFHKMIDKAFSS
jgi:hypothetical protein